MKEYSYKIRSTEEQNRELKLYFDCLSTDMILFALRFAYNRAKAESGGYLMPGRKSKVKRETFLLTKEQAKRRLGNWKPMIQTYRYKGYSYPTISRIKKN